MKKMFLAILALLCLQNSTINCGFFFLIGMSGYAIASVNAWGNIVYKSKEYKEDKSWMYGKAFAFTGLTFYLGYQFFKNFHK